MDVQLHKSRALHYGLNDRPDDDLKFLSLEEQECILFFEETIGSLEEDDERTGISAVQRPASYTTAPLHSPVDHDIIDLVHPSPDPSKHRNTLPVMPDYQELIVPPETHFELKPKHDVPDGLQEEFGHQPPPGSVPTPVVIASKIAEHQGASGTSASQLLQRRRSLESPTNPSAKHGPPTHTKPLRLPDSINMLRSSREHIPHSIATEAVGVQERRAQMLANLTGPAHPLDGGEPACVRNLPMRSISFRDPTPDKSRMEALSKLGLCQRRAQSVMHSSPRDSDKFKTGGTTLNMSNSANASGDLDTTDHCQTRSSPAPTLKSAEAMHSDFNSYGGSNKMEALSKARLPQRQTQSVMHSSPRDSDSVKTGSTTFNFSNPANASAIDTTDHCQTRSSPAPTLKSAEVTHSDFNSYGGKSITLNPTTSFRSEGLSSSVPRTESSEIHINSFGGRSRVMTPSQPIHRNQTRTITPVKEDSSSSNRTSHEDFPQRKASYSEAPVKQPPAPAPKPQRHQSPLSPTGSRPAPLSPEIRRKSLPKPSFRTQGVTVQFSGRGSTDEARRDALRKLGLLRKTS